jgi:hypothetical protein
MRHLRHSKSAIARGECRRRCVSFALFLFLNRTREVFFKFFFDVWTIKFLGESSEFRSLLSIAPLKKGVTE